MQALRTSPDSPAAPPADTAPHLAYAERSLPRYTSYPTALRFLPAADDKAARAWLSEIGAADTISAYVHVPFCRRLCWYCGCNTSIVHDYERVGRYVRTLLDEIELWADALPPHAGLAHLHFGGGSPNALSAEDFVAVTHAVARRLRLRPGAEIAVELDPALLDEDFITACAHAGVTRASLGVQTLDAGVQAQINRPQPFEVVNRAVEGLRRAGVAGINLDLMYGLPGQTPANVAESVETALSLRPDRVAVFGYAHVPWMKKHQAMIAEAALAGAQGRWDQAQAADDVLVRAGYARIGLDHYGLPDDPLAIATADGRLRRNFQGYTDDAAPVLIPFGPSSIGAFAQGFVQNFTPSDKWADAVAAGRLPIAKALILSDEDRLRGEIIERLMCGLQVDVGAICLDHGAGIGALDAEIEAARALQPDGLCVVVGRTIVIPEDARRLVRVVAACFDAYLGEAAGRHGRAV